MSTEWFGENLVDSPVIIREKEVAKSKIKDQRTEKMIEAKDKYA